MEIKNQDTAPANSPKPARKPRRKSVGEVFVTADGTMLKMYQEQEPGAGVEIVGMHLGPRTKWEYPYSYDPILQFSSGRQATGSVYTDRFSGWYGYERVRELQQKHFGKTSDYYSEYPVGKLQEFLRELMSAPKLEVVRIEEHCNQATGYPCWYIAFSKPEEEPAQAANG